MHQCSFNHSKTQAQIVMRDNLTHKRKILIKYMKLVKFTQGKDTKESN